MTFLLDTNACIVFIRGKNPTLSAHFRTHPTTEIGVCSVVVAELLYGAARSQNPVGEAVKVQTFLNPFASLPFDDTAAEQFVRIRTNLEARGMVIGSFDMMIAAVALAHGLTLVTHNTAEFRRVPGLQIVDWEVP